MDNTNALIAALAAITVTTSAAATEINFYCDIDQGFSCKAGQCRPVVQTEYPARYAFTLDLGAGKGSFRSCPSGNCGPPWDLVVLRTWEGIRAVYSRSPEIFDFNDKFTSYTYVWPAMKMGGNDGRHFGRCFRQ